MGTIGTRVGRRLHRMFGFVLLALVAGAAVLFAIGSPESTGAWTLVAIAVLVVLLRRALPTTTDSKGRNRGICRQLKRAPRVAGDAVGAMRPEAFADYRRSREWLARRDRVIARSGNRCECCGGKGPLDVHHLTFKRVGREKDEDLVAACRSCRPAA